MKSSIDGFRQEAEIEATLHQQLAQQFSEELQKLTDFREKLEAISYINLKMEIILF